MFDVFAKVLSSIASFLFPVFASYKALKTSDPAQLTPWLMYWVVLACALLVESWTEWLLVWIPFYAYLRLLFLLYLVLPQTQGARIIYQTHVHPWLEDNEGAIEDFIASAHERLRAAGIAYIKRAIELLKTNVLGLPPSPEAAAAPPSSSGYPQSYTQTLLARFSLPSARWTGSTGAGAASASGTAGSSDFYSFLSSAVSAAAAATAGASTKTGATSSSSAAAPLGMVPDSIRGTTARMSFIEAQRERLKYVLTALDREATQLQSDEAARLEKAAAAAAATTERAPSMSLDGGPGGSLSKSRSEVDFEKLEAESGAEDDMDDAAAGLRRRAPGGGAAATTPAAAGSAATGGAGSWMPWAWGSGAAAATTPSPPDSSRTSGAEQ